jgi:hypothetical protein
VLDPFETESTLVQEPRVLAFSARAFEIPMEELLRHLAFDLVGAIPRILGDIREERRPDQAGADSYRLRFFHLGQAVLAMTSEIEQGDVEHRVLELLGMGADLRVRINMARLRDAGAATADVQEAVRQGRPLGQVRIWGNDNTRLAGVRRTLGKQLRGAGIETQSLGREAQEPTYRPAAAKRLILEALPERDLRVCDQLLALMSALPAEGALRRAPRRMGEHHERIRKGTSIVSHHYEIHRAATGILHMRRREVEAGVERPGLVRTFNVAGLAGAARLRIRDVGGRTTAEFAGSQDTVAKLEQALVKGMGGRA